MNTPKHLCMFNLCTKLHNETCYPCTMTDIYNRLIKKYSEAKWVTEPDFLWSDGNELLTPVKWIADMIAEFLENHRTWNESVTVLTGYYEPDEDERDGCVDNHTGNWYINIE